MVTKEREQYLDIAKGIGIMLVILAHLDINYFLHVWLYSFHLPIFYVIAGICFNYKSDAKAFILKRMKRCLVPYFVLGIVVVLVESKTGYLYGRGFETNLKYLLLQQRYSTLWFLATYFVAEILFYCIVRISKENPLTVFIISIVLSVVFVVVGSTLKLQLPWNIDTAFAVLGYMAFGYFVKRKDLLFDLTDKTAGKKAIVVLGFLILNLVAATLNLIISGGGVDMYWNSYGVFPLTYLAAVSGAMFVLAISQLIKSRYIAYVGRCSMLFFAWHQSVIFVPLRNTFGKVGFSSLAVGMKHVMFIIVMFVSIMIICTLLDQIIRKCKLGFILGE